MNAIRQAVFIVAVLTLLYGGLIAQAGR